MRGQNIAMTNRAIARNESRIDKIERKIDPERGGIDVVFKPSNIDFNEVTTVINDFSLMWLDEEAMSNAVIYEAQVPSSRISNLRPAGMCKAHIVDDNNAFIADIYQPLEQFVINSDDSVLFTPSVPASGSTVKKNFGGNIQNLIMVLTDAGEKYTDMDELKTDLKTKIIDETNTTDINALYYIQITDYMTAGFAGNNPRVDSFTVHFE